MNWSEFPLNPGGRTLRQFGGAWLAFFSVLGAYHYFARAHHSLGLALGLMAFLVGLPGLVQPRLVKWVFVVSTLLASNRLGGFSTRAGGNVFWNSQPAGVLVRSSRA